VWFDCFVFSVAGRSERFALFRLLGRSYDFPTFLDFTYVFHT